MNRATGTISILLFSFFPILFVFFRNKDFIADAGLHIPLLLVGSIALFIYFIFNRINQKYTNNAFIVILMSSWFLLYGHVYCQLLELFSLHYSSLRHRYFFPIYSFLFIFPIWQLWKTKRIDNKALQITLIIGLVLNLQFITPILDQVAFTQKRSAAISEKVPSIASFPDVYYLITDTYPNAENLKTFYQFDNSLFIDQLKKLDFQVIDNAKCNYPYTYFSLPSSLNMEYINYFEDSVSIKKQNGDFPFKRIHKNKTVDNFKSKDYKYINFQSAYEEINTPEGADIYYESPKTINYFSQKLIELSVISTLNIKIFSRQIYDLTLLQFENLKKVPQIEGSKFVFFHCWPPHPPQVFHKDGTYVENLPIVENTYQLKEAYISQLQFINTKLIETINFIIANSKNPPIIIIQGDHGTCSSEKFENELKWKHPPSEELLKERYGILNALLIPENYKVPLDSTHTPVNTFRVLNNLLFGDSLELLPNKYYFANYRKPYNFEEIEWKQNEEK